MDNLLPYIMASLSFGAALVCYFSGKPVTGTYYLASSVLLACVILQAKGFR